ncbi:MAG: hypothetical protein R2873_28325 [Caldilineaceae bacterium]
MAIGLGAHVTVLDLSHNRLQYLDDVFRGQLEARTSNEANIEEAVAAGSCDQHRPHPWWPRPGW